MLLPLLLAAASRRITDGVSQVVNNHAVSLCSISLLLEYSLPNTILQTCMACVAHVNFVSQPYNVRLQGQLNEYKNIE